jgi:anaerobic magnesium-protoporphyrin IX monomethyl ester cyclase
MTLPSRRKKREPAPLRGTAGVTTLLLFPPQWTPQNPHYAITSIAGHMRSRGHRVLLRDLNVELYDELLTPEYLQLSRQKVLLNQSYLRPRCAMNMMLGDTSTAHRIETLKLQEIDRFLKEEKKTFDTIGELIMDAKETFRDRRRFYNPLLLVDAFCVLDKALEIISLPYYPARLSFNGFSQPHCLFNTHSLIVHTGDKELNMFHSYFAGKVPGLLAHEPSLIAFSINSFSQVLPGLTLARMVKSQAPSGCLICIGGNFFTRVKETLRARPEFFQHFAHVVALGEGEKQMAVMADIWKKRDMSLLSRVPSILYFDEPTGAVISSKERAPEKLDRLGFQDFEGLPLEKYFTPDLVACIQSSKGCYWGKCTFCDSDFGVKKDVKSHDRLIAEARHLKDRFGIRHFEFIDESIRPEYMKEIARRLLEEKLRVCWFSNGRTEEGFDGELLELLFESGLTMILWGFESGSERIMNLINKGVSLKKRVEILSRSSQAGIWNFAYIFFGFPTETEEEAMDTIRALCDHKDVIHSYGRSVFTLGKHSILRFKAEKYGIFDIMEEGEELSTEIKYRSRSGLTDEKVDELMKRCTKICAAHYDYSLWYYLRSRENIHLYCAQHGRDYVRDFKYKEALSGMLEAW